MKYFHLIFIFLIIGCSEQNKKINEKQKSLFTKIRFVYKNDANTSRLIFNCSIDKLIQRGKGERNYHYNENLKLIRNIRKCEKLFDRLDSLLTERKLKTSDIKKFYNDSLIFILFKESFKSTPKHYGLIPDSVSIIESDDKDIERLQVEIEYFKLKNLIYSLANEFINGNYVYPYPIAIVKNEDRRALVYFGIFDTFPVDYTLGIPIGEQIGKVEIKSIKVNDKPTLIPTKIENHKVYQEIFFDASKKGIYKWEGFYYTASGPFGRDSFLINGQFEIE